MEKLKNIATIVLSILVLWLLADRYLISNRRDTPSPALPAQTATTAPAGNAAGLRLAYVNVDSVLLGYNEAVRMNDQFAAKQRKSEAEFNRQMKEFEKDYLAFQEKAQRNGFLSAATMEAQQQELVHKKENLDRLNERLTTELLDEQQRLNEVLLNTIVGYVDHYNQTAGYDMIFTNTGMGTILYGAPALNITRQIVDGLNAQPAAR